jgi:hypothetical protein
MLSKYVDENIKLLRSYRILSSMLDTVSATKRFCDGPKNYSYSYDRVLILFYKVSISSTKFKPWCEFEKPKHFNILFLFVFFVALFFWLIL